MGFDGRIGGLVAFLDGAAILGFLWLVVQDYRIHGPGVVVLPAAGVLLILFGLFRMIVGGKQQDCQKFLLASFNAQAYSGIQD
jgi:hypothetical protein